jgi:hypothetical protein
VISLSLKKGEKREEEEDLGGTESSLKNNQPQNMRCVDLTWVYYSAGRSSVTRSRTGPSRAATLVDFGFISVKFLAKLSTHIGRILGTVPVTWRNELLKRSPQE